MVPSFSCLLLEEFDVNSLSMTTFYFSKLFFPGDVFLLQNESFTLSRRINAVQNPQNLMGRHRRVSQTVPIGFIPLIAAQSEEKSTGSCPGVLAQPSGSDRVGSQLFHLSPRQ